MTSQINTRILVVSDTHGEKFQPAEAPLQAVDVAIHCGDISDKSTLQEYRTAIELLKGLNAPVKLVIGGNHDFTLDDAAFQRELAGPRPPPEGIYDCPGEARWLFEAARKDGIVFLNEGTHHVPLANGGLMTVYASPYTRGGKDRQGFQYALSEGHKFDVQEGTDVVITHGPPQGMLDKSWRQESAGCPQLLEAVARARPKVHCFGHIHEGWGSSLITWANSRGDNSHRQRRRHRQSRQSTDASEVSHAATKAATEIDASKSYTIETLASLSPLGRSWRQTTEAAALRQQQLKSYERERCCRAGVRPEEGSQTLFVNAAAKGYRSKGLPQRPWLVEIGLPSIEQWQRRPR